MLSSPLSMAFSAACLWTRPYGVLLAVAGIGLLAVAGHAQEDNAAMSFSVGDDGRVRIEVPSAADLYHVLYYQWDADDAATEYAVAIHMGAEGSVVLTEPLRVATDGVYRVATFRRDAPGDVDGDGTDDLTELARTEAGDRAPLNRAAQIPPEHGAIAIPDIATFERLSYEGPNVWIDTQLRDIEHIKFVVFNPANADAGVYFMNTNRWNLHKAFEEEVLDWPWHRDKHMRGEIIYHPHIVGPNGEVGLYRYEYQHFHTWSFEQVARSHELIAASVPFLRNNLVFYPLPSGMARYEREKAKYDRSRVPVFREEEFRAGSVLEVFNPAVGYGLLGVFDIGDRPTFRDIAILRRLPNELPAVAGVISLHLQTPLSHVNLRAVQDGIPNAYIGNALDDSAIMGLVGKYVRFEAWRDPGRQVGDLDTKRGDLGMRAGFKITEATAEEVAAHHAARRPAAAQTPSRDLTVTTYQDLDDIAFADSDAFGVKAANVAAMRDFGFAAGTVPDGYALPFYFYDAFMKHNDFYDDVDTLLADTDFQTDIGEREDELKKLRRRIKNGAMPAWMATRLGELQAEFPASTPIRCRSSTNNEDLPGFSGAGLYDSYTHHPTEGHLSKSIKQVFASLWNLRAFEEREFYRVDHKAAAMGVLLHLNYSDEKANGVAVSDDPFYGTADRFYVNAQVGEDLVTNPSALAVPEELLLGTGEEFTTTLVQHSNLVADDARVLSAAHITALQATLRTIHSRFYTLYEVAEDEEFAMEIEFKITAAGTFAVKQARPWVY